MIQAGLKIPDPYYTNNVVQYAGEKKSGFNCQGNNLNSFGHYLSEWLEYSTI